MLELGDKALEHHLSLVPYIINIKPRLVIVLGKNMEIVSKALHNKIPLIIGKDHKDVYEHIIQQVQNNEVVFLKGSFGSSIHLVVKMLSENSS